MKKRWNPYIDPPRSRLPDDHDLDRSRRMGFLIAIVLAIALFVLLTH